MGLKNASSFSNMRNQKIMADNNALYKALVQHLVKQGEGFREHPYKDTRGYNTIGYGFNLDDPSVRRAVGRHATYIDRDTADNLLGPLIATAEQDARAYIGPQNFDRLDHNRRAVLVDMAYNLGGPKLGGFNEMRKALLARDYQRAGSELENSNYFKQVKSRGVRNRDLMAGKTMARFKQGG